MKRQNSIEWALGLLFLYPLLRPPLETTYPIKFTLAPFWVSLVLLIGFSRFRKIYLPASAARILLLLLLLTLPVLTLSFFQGEGVFLLAWILLIYLLIIFAAILSDDNIKRAYLIFLTVLLIIALFTLTVFYLGSEFRILSSSKLLITIVQQDLTGPFLNRNVFGAMMTSCWIIVIWIWQKRPFSPLLLTVFIFSCTVALATMSRSVFFLVILVSSTVGYALIHSGKMRQLILFLTLVGFCFFLAEILIGLGERNEQINSLYERIQHSRQEGFVKRKIIWLSSFALWLKAPLFGIGLGQLSAHYLDGQWLANQLWNDLPNGSGFTGSAHNLALHLMAEAGVAGLLFVLIITFILLALFIRHSRELHLVHWPALMITCILWIQSMVNVTLTTPHSIFYFVFFFGITLKLIHSSTIYLNKLQPFITLIVISISIFMATITIRHFISWQAFEQWINSKSQASKKLYVDRLLEDEQVMPYFVEHVTHEILENPARRYQITTILPYIERAWSLQQKPILLQGKFIGLTKVGKFAEACILAQFITDQHWKNDVNHTAYKRACQGLLPEKYDAFWF